METQETLESRIADAQKRKGPLEGPIRQILESQDRMEANIATLTAAVKILQLKWEPDTPIAHWCWRHKL